MELVMEYGLQLLTALFLTLLSVLGAYLTLKLSKREDLKNINEAQKQIIAMTQQTVLEVKQVLTDDLKLANGGKLTDEQKAEARAKLWELVEPKLALSAVKLLEAASIDVQAFIMGTAEKYLKEIELGLVPTAT